MAGLEVQIGADKKDFDKKIKEVEFDIKQLAKEKKIQIKAGLDTSEITANIKDAKKSLNELRTVSKDAGDSFSKGFAPKVANGGNALMQFSRIAQDAPYGIQGIGNNITATAEAFSYLKNQSGSTVGALKAVAGSLMGTGGVLLAVSLVTSGLTYMSQNGLTVNDVFQKLTGTFDENAKAMSEINKESIKNSAAQIASVGAYVSAAKNINLSMSDRLIAVKKLQDEYPAYFGNLTKEQILNGDVASAVKGVTAALIAKAKAASAVDKIVKLSEEEAVINEKIGKSIKSISKFYQLSKKEEAEVTAMLNRQLRGEIDLVKILNDGKAQTLTKTAKTALAAFQYSQTLKDLSTELKTNVKQQDKLTESVNQSTAAQIKLDTAKTGGSNKAKSANVTPQVEAIQNTLTPNTELVSLSGMLSKTAKDVEGYEGVISTSLGRIPGYFDTSGQAALLRLQEFNESANELIVNSIGSTFSNLGTIIGEALASGGNVLNAIGNGLLQSLGSFLSDMGGLLIKYGTLAVVKGKLDLAILTGGPVSIGAGIAAIGVGVALKAAGGAIGKMSSSGAGKSTSTGSDYSSPASGSRSYGSSSDSGTQRYVFEISGQTLIGVLSNTLDKNTRLGGSLGI